MSGRQQRVMVQPIVRSVYFVVTPILITHPSAECYFQKSSASALQTTPSCTLMTLSIQRTKVVIWLYDNIEMRIEGRITVRDKLGTQHRVERVSSHSRGHTNSFSFDSIFEWPTCVYLDLLFPLFSQFFRTWLLIYQPNQGFDEFMNVVLDEAAEVYVKEAQPRRELGMYATGRREY